MESGFSGLSSGLRMLSLYPVFVVIATLMVTLPVLIIVEDYFLLSSLYTALTLRKISRSMKVGELSFAAALMFLVVASGELAIWMGGSSELSGFVVLLAKAIFCFMLGSSPIVFSVAARMGSGMRNCGLMVAAGSILVTVPSPITAILALPMVMIMLWLASSEALSAIPKSLEESKS